MTETQDEFIMPENQDEICEFIFNSVVEDLIEIYINHMLVTKHEGSFYIDPNPNDLKSEDVEKIAIDAAKRVFELVETIIIYGSDELPDLTPVAREIAFELIKGEKIEY